MSQSKLKRDSRARRGSEPDSDPEPDSESDLEPDSEPEPEPDSESEPDLEDDSDSCPVCGEPLADKPQKTFLGFRKFPCTNCSNFELFPLSTGYRVFYWVGTCGVVLYTLALAPTAGGGNAVARVLGGASVYLAPFAFALVKDHRLRQQRQ